MQAVKSFQIKVLNKRQDKLFFPVLILKSGICLQTDLFRIN